MAGAAGRMAGGSQHVGTSVYTHQHMQSQSSQQLFYRDGSPYTGPLQQHQQHRNTSTTLQAGLSAAGLTPAHMGLSGSFMDPRSSHNSAGEGDLLSTLCRIGEVTRRKRSSHWLRPDYHIPTDKVYSEMTYRELLFGMTCVQKKLMFANLPNWSARDYGDHMRFVAMKGLTNSFTAPALARYEHDLTLKVLSGEVETFTAADHEPGS